MKYSGILIIFSLIIFSSGIVRCSKSANNEINPLNKLNPDTIIFAHLMKSWELYRWPVGNDWNYSVLIGTDRVNSYEDVTTNKIIVSGTDFLKMLVDNKQKEFLEFVLSKYIESGVDEIDQEKLPILLQNKYQSLGDAIDIFGDTARISKLFIEFQKFLYQALGCITS